MRAKQDRAGDHDRARGMALLIHGDAAFAGEGVVQEIAQPEPARRLQRPAARSTSSSTTRSASPRRRRRRARPPTPPTSPRCCRSRSSTSTARTRRRWPRWCGWRIGLPAHVPARRGRSTCTATAAAATTRATSRRSPSRSVPADRAAARPSARATSSTCSSSAGSRGRRPTGSPSSARSELERELAEARSQRLRARAARRRPASGAATAAGRSADVQDVDTGVAAGELAGAARRADASARGLPPAPEDRARARRSAARWPRASGRSTGRRPRRWRSRRWRVEGHRVRLSGQDTARGTFSQRHAVLHDVEDGARTCRSRTSRRTRRRSRSSTARSPRRASWASSTATAWTAPTGSSLWEAQFGDFVNAAQVIIDQFIVSAEEKWRRLSGLVLLLPHGFEGQGPEHSSARLERFLAAGRRGQHPGRQPDHAAQYFHVLRRQVRPPVAQAAGRDDAEEPAAAPDGASRRSTDLAQRELPARDRRRGGRARRRSGASCSAAARSTTTSWRSARSSARDDVAIVRLEQLYPLRDERARRGRSRPTRRRHAGRLGAGRAGEHGRVALPARALRRPAASARCPFSGCLPRRASAQPGAPDEQAALTAAIEQAERRAAAARRTIRHARRAQGARPSASRSPRSQIGDWLKQAGDRVRAGRAGGRDRDRQGHGRAARARRRACSREILKQKGETVEVGEVHRTTSRTAPQPACRSRPGRRRASPDAKRAGARARALPGAATLRGSCRPRAALLDRAGASRRRAGDAHAAPAGAS